MERVQAIAWMCIGRAVMFGSLAIFCMMVSFSFNPPAALRIGAVLTLAMAAILLVKAHYALRQRPNHTEVWLHLDDSSRPTTDETRRDYARTLRDVYLRFAAGSFAVACAMFAVSVALVAAGMKIEGIPLAAAAIR